MAPTPAGTPRSARQGGMWEVASPIPRLGGSIRKVCQARLLSESITRQFVSRYSRAARLEPRSNALRAARAPPL